MSDEELGEVGKARHAAIFSTPLFTHAWDGDHELNAVLRERILDHMARQRGVAKSNRGGWHSEIGELEFCDAPGRRLVARMRALGDEATRRVLAADQQRESAMRWSVTAWANVNRQGDFNAVHVHPGSTWSGTYYVDAGEPVDADNGTSLQLFDPCQGRSTLYPPLGPASVYIRPKPGLMVLFPSYVPHMVFPHDGAGARISVAFNLSGQPQS